MANEPAVEVARITARQAIIVATISALCGLCGAGLTAYLRSDTPKLDPPKSPIQHFLKMPTRIDGLEEGTSVRIVADVNGQGYSYPTYDVWTDVKPDMPTERFALPTSQTDFNVKFKIFIRRKDGKIDEVETNTNTVPARAIVKIDPQRCVGIFHKGGFQQSAAMTVQYQIE